MTAERFDPFGAIAADPALCAARERRADLDATIVDREAGLSALDAALDAANDECGQLLAAKIAGRDVDAALQANRERRCLLTIEREDLLDEIALLRREDAAELVTERQADRAARRAAAVRVREDMDGFARENHRLLVDAFRRVAEQAGMLALVMGLEANTDAPEIGGTRIVDRAVGDVIARAMSEAGLSVDEREIQARPWPSPFRQPQATEPDLIEADDDESLSVEEIDQMVQELAGEEA